MEEQIFDDGFEDYLDDDFEIDPPFYNPGSNSALRAGERVHPCPTCKQPDRLTDADVRLGYQCDTCADALEQGGY